MKKKKPSTYKVKQKQKWYWRTKNVYLIVTILAWDSVMSIFMQIKMSLQSI